MSIESVVEAESIFETTMTEVNRYLRGQVSMWSQLKKNEIWIKDMRDKFKNLFETLDNINEHWEQLRPYFPINRLWFFWYGFSIMFLNNRKPSRKDMELMR